MGNLIKVVPLALGAAAFGRFLRRRKLSVRAASSALPPTPPVAGQERIVLRVSLFLSSVHRIGVPTKAIFLILGEITSSKTTCHSVFRGKQRLSKSLYPLVPPVPLFTPSSAPARARAPTPDTRVYSRRSSAHY